MTIQYLLLLDSKWHVGYSKNKYTPLERGFDKHIGFYQFSIDYWNKIMGSPSLRDKSGYDWFKNGKPLAIDNNQYSTYQIMDEIMQDIDDHSINYNNIPMFMYIALQNPHLPLSSPLESEECQDIVDINRKKFCENILVLDNAIGDIIETLKTYNLWDDTLILFSSDNGANVFPTTCPSFADGMIISGTNYPYRGGKLQLFEGGILTPGFISGAQVPIKNRGTQYNGLFHAVDWYKIIMHASITNNSNNMDIDNNNLDGIDLWDDIFHHNGKTRNNIPLNINKLPNASYITTAIRNNQYKLIINDNGFIRDKTCNVYGPKPGSIHWESNIIQDNGTYTNNDGDLILLFDLDDDPFETSDLLDGNGFNSDKYSRYKDIIDELLGYIDTYINDGYARIPDMMIDNISLPEYHNGYWIPYQ